MLANHSLQHLNSLAMPSQAEFFAQVADGKQLSDVLANAQRLSLTVQVLGSGSNLLLPERVLGLVLQMTQQEIQVVEEDDQTIVVQVSAGYDWPNLVMHCAQQEWWGLENLAAIPGTMGAAPIQNIGAYGAELSQTLSQLTARHRYSGLQRTFSAAQCQFSYRQSVFKQPEHQDQWLIESVCLRLSKLPAPNCQYGPLQALQGQQLSATAMVNAVTEIRQQRLPDPKRLPNAGSFFHNPVVSASLAANLQQQYPGIPTFVAAQGYKLSAGWLIEQAGYKGKSAPSGVGMYAEHALVLINPEHQGLTRVLNFAREVQDAVFDRFGVRLQIEPRVLGA